MIKVITGSGQLQGLSLPLQTPKVMEKNFFFFKAGEKIREFHFLSCHKVCKRISLLAQVNVISKNIFKGIDFCWVFEGFFAGVLSWMVSENWFVIVRKS